MIIDGVTNCSVGGWLREFCFLCTTFGVKELLLESVFLKDLFLYFQLYIFFFVKISAWGVLLVYLSLDLRKRWGNCKEIVRKILTIKKIHRTKG